MNKQHYNQRVKLAFKYIFCTSLCVAFFSSMLSASEPIVQNKDKLELVAFDSCPYVCAEGPQRGALIDIVEEIFRRNNMLVSITLMPTQRALSSTLEGKSDGIIGILRGQLISLEFPTQSIGQYQKIMYVNSDDSWTYTGLNSLNNRTIGVELGEPYGVLNHYITRNQDNTKRIQKFTGGDTLSRRIKSLQLGRTNLFFADKNEVDYILKANQLSPSIHAVGALSPDNIYVAFNHPEASGYAQIVSQGMIALHNSGKLEEILNNYGMSDWQNWYRDFNTFEPPTRKTESNITKTQRNNGIDNADLQFVNAVEKGSGYWRYASKFKELVERRSHGKLRVHIRSTEDSEHNVVMDVADGTVQMGMAATNNVAPYAPSLGALTLPYLFDSISGAKKLLLSDAMFILAERSAQESNVRPLSFYIGGYRLIANNVRPVTKSTDLRGLKIRVPDNQIMVEAFRAWGVEPIPLPWPEVFPALENGLIDGKENPLNIIFSGINRKKEVWDTLKYVTKNRYFLFTAPHLISESFYQSLSSDSQRIIERAALEAAQYSWQETAQEEQALMKLAKQHGMTFVDADNERDDWQAKAQATWPKLYFKVGGKAWVDSITAELDKDK
ncbi:TRAP transporter substrate-binding protein DctP [Pseudoalteromonas sp. SSDWG2]|uniref:TRAP transporter substrate-binding protein DctP n=1 Tax=Pseudoalteromonas sp. SSDWG2 TaxID=3139391 RepID=UPI003BADA9E4